MVLPLNIKLVTLMYCLSKYVSQYIDANIIARFRGLLYQMSIVIVDAQRREIFCFCLSYKISNCIRNDRTRFPELTLNLK